MSRTRSIAPAALTGVIPMAAVVGLPMVMLCMPCRREHWRICWIMPLAVVGVWPRVKADLLRMMGVFCPSDVAEGIREARFTVIGAVQMYNSRQAGFLMGR